jgi:transposase-like protein
MKTADVCRRHGIGSATFFKWKSKYTWFGPAVTRTNGAEFQVQAD